MILQQIILNKESTVFPNLQGWLDLFKELFFCNAFNYNVLVLERRLY